MIWTNERGWINGNGRPDYAPLVKLLGPLIVDMILGALLVLFVTAAEVKVAVRGSDDVWPFWK